MMGGLKTIYDKDGNVTFEDSRVFFGSEKVTLQQAIDLHNGTGDTALKSELGKVLESDPNAEKPSGESDYSIKGTDPDQVKASAIIKIPTRVSMLELGFAPTFYQFVDSIIEVRIAISISSEYSYGVEYSSETSNSSGFAYKQGRKNSKKGRTDVNYNSVHTSSVNASYAGRYNYSAEGSSLLRTKLTPIPPPPILDERIRRMMDAEFGK